MPDPRHALPSPRPTSPLRLPCAWQTKEVFIKKYCFRQSIEETIVKLHEKIKGGEIKIVDGHMPHEAYTAVSEAGKSMTAHDFSGPVHTVQTTGSDDPSYSSSMDSAARSSYTPDGGLSAAAAAQSRRDKYRKEHAFTRSFSVQECVTCGECRDVCGSSTYKGVGIFSYLNDITRDPPAQYCDPVGGSDAAAPTRHFVPGGHGRFARVPRPPVGWRGLRELALGNGEREPEGGFGVAQTPDLAPLKAALRVVFAEEKKLAEGQEKVLKDAEGRHQGFLPTRRPSPKVFGFLTRSQIKECLRKKAGFSPRVLTDDVLMYSDTVIDELCVESDHSYQSSSDASYVHGSWGMLKLK